MKPFGTGSDDATCRLFDIKADREVNTRLLANKETHPQIIVATPGRLNALVREKKLRLSGVKVFVPDECDKELPSKDSDLAASEADHEEDGFNKAKIPTGVAIQVRDLPTLAVLTLAKLTRR